MDSHPLTIRNFSARTVDGDEVDLGDYFGQVLLIVNTATECGLANQFRALQQIHARYHDAGFSVLAFPCNQFGNQEPGTNAEILKTCREQLQLTFPIFAKIDVNGSEAHPLFRWLVEETSGELKSKIKWNFTKFLVDRNGRVIARVDATTKPEQMVTYIERLIAASQY